jgi:uncharacterized protein (DUF427 family)
MEIKSNPGKEVKVPGRDHPITVSPAEGSVRVTVAGRIVAESKRALRLEEKGYPPVYYVPRSDADMSLLERTEHYTYCPYKGDCTYYSTPSVERNRKTPCGHMTDRMRQLPTLRSIWRSIRRASTQLKLRPERAA